MARVTVLGTGNMGSALVRAFVATGHSVTVWNRTAANAEVLRSSGVSIAESLAAAMNASPLVVVCMMSYDNLYEQTSSAEASNSLRGRSIVNLMLGTAAEAGEAAHWASHHGATYLDGAIPVYPSDIGLPGTSVTYAGDEMVWSEHAPTLMALGGRSNFFPGNVAVPNVLENSLSVWFYHVAHLALLEAAGVAHSLGATQQAVEDRTDEVLGMLGQAITSVFDDLRAGRFTDSQATIDVHRAALETARADAIDCSGTSLTLNSGIDLLAAAGTAGLGGQNLAALAQWVRVPH